MAETVLPGLPGLEQIELVGRGASGSVFRAWQPQFGRWVAVKVLAQSVDAEEAERFQRECRALGGLSGHPHVVEVHGAGFLTDGRPYLVMPFLAGGSLADALKAQGPAPVGRVLDVGVKVASALSAAHGLGVLHRDVKPDNVLLTQYGEPQLADFGIARLETGALTRTGTYAGTPLHTAPEVLAGQRATVASDVYGLGSTLHRLLAGRAAFASDTDESVFPLFQRIANDAPPDLRELGVPAPVADVLERSMAKAPGDRQPSARALAEELQRAQLALGAPASVAPGIPAPDAGPPSTPPPAPAQLVAPEAGPGGETHLGPSAPPAAELVTPPAAVRSRTPVYAGVGALAALLAVAVGVAALTSRGHGSGGAVSGGAVSGGAVSGGAVQPVTSAAPALPPTSAAPTSAAPTSAAPTPDAGGGSPFVLGDFGSLSLLAYGTGDPTMSKGPVQFGKRTYTVAPQGMAYSGKVTVPHDMDHTVRFYVSDAKLFARPDGTVYGTVAHAGNGFSIAAEGKTVTFANVSFLFDSAGKASAVMAQIDGKPACPVLSMTSLVVSPASGTERIDGQTTVAPCAAVALNDAFGTASFQVGSPLGRITTSIALGG